MATPSVVPRQDNEGNLGTSTKKWIKMYSVTGFQVGADDVAGTFQMTNSNNGELIWEGSGADANETSLQAINPTADLVYQLQNHPTGAGTYQLATTDVAGGGTGATTFTDGGVLLGGGTGAITAMAVLGDGEFIVGDGTTDPVAESGVTARTSMGVSRGESFILACSDETTLLTTGTAKVTFRMPYAFTLTEVRASVNTAPTGAMLVVDINEAGSTILATDKLTIDISEKTSETAATPPALSDTSLADDAEITVDIDTVGSTVAGKGLKVTLIGYQTTPV
jgi:hypothetical protein